VYEPKLLKQLQCMPLAWHADVILLANHIKIALAIQVLMRASNELSIKTTSKPVNLR